MGKLVELVNFIGSYENVLSPGQCEELIRLFKELKEAKIASPARGFPTGQVDDVRAPLISSALLTNLTVLPIYKEAFEAIEFTTSDYMCRFPNALVGDTAAGKVMTEEIMLQETSPSGGFHSWHCESWESTTASRFLTWILYLNDIEEGGETEFLYQRKRISPKQGDMLVWPTGFTHMHRGNPPLEEKKYILTGWLRWIK